MKKSVSRYFLKVHNDNFLRLIQVRKELNYIYIYIYIYIYFIPSNTCMAT